MTWGDMCEVIAVYGNATVPGDYELTGRDVWEASPRGELFHIHPLYELALEWLDTLPGDHPAHKLVEPFLTEKAS